MDRQAIARDENGQSANGTYWGVAEWRKRQADRRRVEVRLERERRGADYPYNYQNKPY